MKRNILKVLLGLSIIAIMLTPSAMAAMGYTQANADGLYIGVLGNYYSISGTDFDGEHFIYGYDELIVIPKPKGNIGFTGVLGFREGDWALEIGYTMGFLKGSFLGTEGDVTLSMFLIAGKWFLMTESPLQPYILGGLDLAWMSVEDGSITLDEPIMTDNGLFSGISLDLGGGIAYYLSPNFAINAGVTVHFLMLSDVQGVLGESYTIDQAVSGTGLNANFGFTYIFD